MFGFNIARIISEIFAITIFSYPITVAIIYIPYVSEESFRMKFTIIGGIVVPVFLFTLVVLNMCFDKDFREYVEEFGYIKRQRDVHPDESGETYPINDNVLCLICSKRVRNIAPQCGHLVMCKTCVERGKIEACPVCRIKFRREQLITVYLS